MKTPRNNFFTHDDLGKCLESANGYNPYTEVNKYNGIAGEYEPRFYIPYCVIAHFSYKYTNLNKNGFTIYYHSVFGEMHEIYQTYFSDFGIMERLFNEIIKLFNNYQNVKI